MGNQKNRRRQIVVDKALQSRIVFATAWAPGLCLAATSLLLGVFCARLYNEALQADVDLPSIMPVFVISMSFMLVATVYMLFGALKFSHRIAGPMYNVGKTIDLFRKGDIGARVHLRKGDYLMEVADHLNGFLDWLEENPPAGYERLKEAFTAEASDAEIEKGAETETETRTETEPETQSEENTDSKTEEPAAPTAAS